MRHVRVLKLLLLAGAVLGVAGCGCVTALGIRVSPGSATIAVGATFTPTVVACGSGSGTASLVWSTTNVTIVSVDAATGRTKGLRPGLARVEGRADEGVVSFRVRVTDGRLTRNWARNGRGQPARRWTRARPERSLPVRPPG